MAKAKLLIVPCANHPGTLAHVARTLGDAKVNILAFQVTTQAAEGRAHLVVDKTDKAKKALEAAGLSCTEENVLHVELPDVPGSLAAFAGKLAANDINITSAWATTVKKSKKADVVFAVSDLEKAARIR